MMQALAAGSRLYSVQMKNISEDVATQQVVVKEASCRVNVASILDPLKPTEFNVLEGFDTGFTASRGAYRVIGAVGGYHTAPVGTSRQALIVIGWQ